MIEGLSEPMNSVEQMQDGPVKPAQVFLAMGRLNDDVEFLYTQISTLEKRMQHVLTSPLPMTEPGGNEKEVEKVKLATLIDEQDRKIKVMANFVSQMLDRLEI